MTSARPLVVPIPTICSVSNFDEAQHRLIRSLYESIRNIEASLDVLEAVARAQAAYQDMDSEIIGARKALLSDD